MIAREGLSTVLRTSGFGTVDPDGTAVLDIDVVESAGRSVSDDPTWDTGWSTMIAYARSKEWVTADGRGVRAHVEYESSTDETP
ncbi:hypothetical protein R3Q08_31055 [Rhodococcus erythropolis]|uniref:hypothetical protein n=1 Tax=Rhodococcus erythropolis TaxID=1833 RepID=UPI00294919B5|nr:hypothetical protein [Rhodococcus erythropolis]MDV6212703.1 hypothetical protein [Rhodococcus erythropolis]